MSTPVITVAPTASVHEAHRIMQERGVHHLPVMDGERLIGMISDRDVQLHLAPPGLGRLSLAAASLLSTRTVTEVMAPAVTIGPDEHADEAAGVMLARGMGAVPVVEDGRLVGIVTTTDLLGAWVGNYRGGRVTEGHAEPALEKHERSGQEDGNLPVRLA